LVIVPEFQGHPGNTFIDEKSKTSF
jgi:hypothetical protein